jgi:protease I
MEEIMAIIPKDIYQPDIQSKNSTSSVLFITADKTEDLEFFYPYYRLIEEGYHVDVATPDGGAFKGKQGLGLSESKKISDVRPEDYQLLYIPGGKAPAELKNNDDALAFTKQFVALGKPVASICHGPQLLAEANVIKGKNIAAWPEVEDELIKAGATFANEKTITDGQFTTARWPADLPSHVAKVLEILKSANKTQQKTAA